MKLLHLTNFYPPYSVGQPERQCRLIVNELAGRGHFNRVLTSAFLLPGVPDHERFVSRRLRLAKRSSPSPLASLLWMQRANHRTLCEEINEIQFDIVVVWSMAGLSNSLIHELFRSGMCVAFAVLDHWPRMRLREDPWMQWWTSSLPLSQRLLRQLMRRTFIARYLLSKYPADPMTSLPMQDGFFASRALRESIRTAGIEVGDAPVIPYCVGRDEIPGQPQRRDELRRLLWIGRLDADRDPMTAIQAVQELRHHGQHNYTLDILGRGDVGYESRMHNYLRDAQLGGVVTIRHASVEEMFSLFPTYDILLHTARYPGPFPMVVLRAMAARLPVISTMEGPCADVLRHQENCLAFRTGDPVECAERIRALSANRPMVDEMAERAYREILDTYSAAVVAGRVERVLSELLRERAFAPLAGY